MKSDVDVDADQDKKDFSLLQDQLLSISRSSSAATTRSANEQTEHRPTLDPPPSASPLDINEIWPLYLHPYFLEHYIFGDIIGYGSYAQVRECADSRTLERLAVKIINLKSLNRHSQKLYNNQLQEIKFLKKMNHRNILWIRECLFRGSKVYLFMEFCTINVQSLLEAQPKKRLNPSTARNLFKQLICGLNYIHSLGIVHRDIKPQNLLINNIGELKIIDFGVSHILNLWQRDNFCSNYEGSPLFQAPEVVAANEKYDGFKVDVWSAGITLYLMVYGSYPFEDDALLGLYDKVLALNPNKPPNLENLDTSSEVLNDLLYRMLDKVSERRIDTDSVTKHPWLFLESELDSSDLISLTSSILEKKNNFKLDIYRSMSVLSYLYVHHFPDQRIFKFKSNLPSTPSSTATNSTASSTVVSLEVSPASLSLASTSSPHEIISDTQTEWGTEQQYNLLKIPQVRTNRIRNEKKKQKSTDKTKKQD